MAAGAELGDVGFGDDEGTAGFEHVDHDVGGGGDVVAVDDRAERGPHPGDGDEVLHRDREPVQVPRGRIGRGAVGEGAGMTAGSLEARRGEGVDRGLDLGDPRLGDVDELER